MAQMAKLNGRAVDARDVAILDSIPAEFECLGYAADGAACTARLTLRAAKSRVVSPYFGACAGAPHVATCDVASRETPPPEPAEDDGTVMTRNPRNGPTVLKILLEPPGDSTSQRSTRSALGEETSRTRSRAEPTGDRSERGRLKTLRLDSILSRLMGDQSLGVESLRMPDGRTLPLGEALVPINAVGPETGRRPRYYWGTLNGEVKSAGSRGVALRVRPMVGRSWQETPAILVPLESHRFVLAALKANSYSKKTLGERGVLVYGRYEVGAFPWITLARPLIVAFSKPHPQ